MLIAVAMIGALYVRRIAPAPRTVFAIVAMILNATVTAMLVEALLGAGSWSIFSITMPVFIGAAIALTWLGMRPLAPVAWGLVLLVGVINLTTVSDAMGVWGYLFVVSTFVGVLLQFDYDLPGVLSEVKLDFVGPPEGGAIGQTHSHLISGQDVNRG
ncbi:hypothetical protein SAMN04488003_10239 [Loktanella fryxellensis]|uniref:Uncharacterized protein n=2 Tax=Loktanella fryxellensis TaxID=245187 RepID=A0A1H7ZLV7_9RHOB|nr:hypothetical protein SAMN04488003_10239 [Loktanella fryxellensis]